MVWNDFLTYKRIFGMVELQRQIIALVMITSKTQTSPLNHGVLPQLRLWSDVAAVLLRAFLWG